MAWRNGRAFPFLSGGTGGFTLVFWRIASTILSLKTGKVVILSGPSGVGKDTVLDAWITRDSNVVRVVTYTTRAPRPGERNGVDYHFVSVSTFFEHAAAGDFLEHKEVHGNHYASPLRDTRDLVASGRVAVLKIDVQGALVAMERLPEALTVFILPPNPDELARRIRERGHDDEANIALRLENARKELAVADRYQHQLVNHDVDEVVDQLERLVGAVS